MEERQTATAVPGSDAASRGDEASLEKIKTLLKAKDDTQRFVGLALLKSVLDNTSSLREEHNGAIQELWASIPVKFLDRLLRTGSNPSNPNAKDMLDLSISVLHTFAALLPDEARSRARMTERIPLLVSSALHTSPESTELLLQLLQTLVSSQAGANVFVGLEDISPLTEIAPSYAAAMDVLNFAWLNAMENQEVRTSLRAQIDTGVQSLASSFRSTDATTFLSFVGLFFRQAAPDILPSNPKWLSSAVSYIQNLVVSRPNAKARAAYTNAAAALLQSYPDQVPKLLFTDDRTEEKPFGYLFVNLLLIDIRSSAPTLLQQLNQPEYAQLSRRLASSFDTISIFVGFLVRSLDDESLETMVMAPDSLLKLRKGISETMSVTVEYLRDRWDASVAGAMGLHPDARTGTAETFAGSHFTLAWDSMKDNADEDPLIQSAVRALALWLREDDNDMLRKEATGLTDMFLDLYRSHESHKLDFRSPVLVAFEALMSLNKGRTLFLQQGGWAVLAKDLGAILQAATTGNNEAEAGRGLEIVRVLLAALENADTANTTDEQLDLITTVSAWSYEKKEQPPIVKEFEVAVMMLCCTILAGAAPGVRKRYVHSIHALRGIAIELRQMVTYDQVLVEDMVDVLSTLKTLTS
ncbi:hypothetical protein NLU13_6994 [Sarocladium strictum]|uniref:Uncharacterized protein n=1 Tax=Sarocladium strictum TaxID=5046 RepID=A0AA39L6E1_SARSR|nr:hypothetical protein NLU13_6994 [Sarocladium strictum]